MSFRRHAMTVGGAQLVQLALTFLSRLVLARLMGPAAFGGFGVALNAVTVWSRVGSLGSASATQYLASRDPHMIREVLGVSVLWSLTIGLVTTGLAWVTLPAFESSLLANQPLAIESFRTLVPALFPIIFTMNLAVVLIPLGRIREYSVIQVLNSAAFIVPFFALSIRMHPVQACLAAQWVTWIAALCVLVFSLKDELKSLRFEADLNRVWWKCSLKAWPNSCLNIGLARLMTFAAAAILSPVQLGIWVLAMNLVEGLFSPVVATGQLLLSRSAQCAQTGTALTSRNLRMISIFTLATLVFLAIAGPVMIGFIFGEVFRDAGALMAALVVTGGAHASMKAISSFAAGRGQPFVATRALVGELGMIGVGMGLCGHLGLVGLASASIVASLTGWAIAVIEYRKLTGLQVAETVGLRVADWQGLTRKRAA